MDQSYINSLTRSMSTYNSRANYWSGQASSAQATINSLNPQLNHKRDQLAKAQAAQSKFGALTSSKTDFDDQLIDLANALGTQMDDDGATNGIKNLDSDFEGHISAASTACNTLVNSLQQEVNNLQASINNAQSSLNTANSNAASARQSAQCYSQAIWRERNSD